MTSPRIYLAVDNCFASKRWTQPSEWMDVVNDVGLKYVEASADNECDPLYSNPEYLNDWVEEVKKHERRTGVKVANLYSGHGTYATLGLAHTDVRIRDHILDNWLKPMIKTAASLNAGLGFFCHAFSDSVLQDRTLYNEHTEDLYNRLAETAAFARDCGVGSIGVEQMYSPHQIPWTIEGTREFLREVYARSGVPIVHDD